MDRDKERMVSGQLYRPNDPELVRERRDARLLADQYNHTLVVDQDERQRLLKLIFGHVGPKRYSVEPPLRVDYGKNISIGEDFYANFETIMLDVAPITIGNNVMFGPRCSLLTAGHPLVADVRNAGYEIAQPIVIGDNVWLGGNVTVLPGVAIGANTVVGAGAVVTKDLPANVVAVGNPAHVLRQLTASDEAIWRTQRAAYDAEMAESNTN